MAVETVPAAVLANTPTPSEACQDLAPQLEGVRGMTTAMHSVTARDMRALFRMVDGLEFVGAALMVRLPADDPAGGSVMALGDLLKRCVEDIASSETPRMGGPAA